MKMLMRRISIRIKFAMDTFFWFIEVCPTCKPVTRLNAFSSIGFITAVCPNCGYRVTR